jgi:hypothetical protein
MFAPNGSIEARLQIVVEPGVASRWRPSWCQKSARQIATDSQIALSVGTVEAVLSHGCSTQRTRNSVTEVPEHRSVKVNQVSWQAAAVRLRLPSHTD